MFYLTREQLPVFIPIGFIGLYRWFWFLLRIMAYCLYKPLPPRKHPRYIPNQDVTILVPTIDSQVDQLDSPIRKALESWLKSDPYQVIFITIESSKDALVKMAKEMDPSGEKIKVIAISRPNKRRQMVYGVNHTKTPIVIFADDDVLWPPDMIKWILAPFEDRQMGGVGTSQAAIPIGEKWTVWEILAAFRISMRNIEITSTTYIDGGVCCLSGRTAAYRTEILRDPAFQWEFTHEYWLNKYHLHSGDDKFLTRWMHSHQWKTFIQACPEAELSSTFKADWTFLKQLLRWTRNTWRSDMKSLFLERQVWSRHPFVAFSMLDKFFNPLTLLAGPITVIYLCTRPQGLPVVVVLASYIVWLLLTRLLKYIPHFIKRPQDVLFVPVWIVFNIYFALMKLYCLATLHVTEWGTRKTADLDTCLEKGDEEEEEEKDLYVPRYPIQDKKKKNYNEKRCIPQRSPTASLTRANTKSAAMFTPSTRPVPVSTRPALNHPTLHRPPALNPQPTTLPTITFPSMKSAPSSLPSTLTSSGFQPISILKKRGNEPPATRPLPMSRD